ncbi:MAG: LysR family transcriptional regulator [Thiobacillaceae bacterium]
MEPDWNDFKIILALARAGSVAGAARMLAIDHSTVSRRLAALEDALGATLVLRGGREFSLTDEGRAALVAAEAQETTVAEALRTIRAAKLDVSGAVRVSCPPGFLPELMRLLPDVRKKYPMLDIEFSGDYRTVDLAKGEADMALRMFRPSEPGLIARRACEAGWGVYASNSYVAKHGLPGSPEALARHHLILYAETMHSITALRWLENHRAATTQFSRVDNLEIASQVIASGGGIGVIPYFFAARHQEMVSVFADPVASDTGWIVYHETARDTARVRAVVDILTAFFESQPELFYRGKCAAGLAD